MSRDKKSKPDKTTRRIPVDLADEVSAFLFTLGNQFTKLNNAEAAFDCFKYSVDLRPTHWPSVYNLATLYGMMGDRESAFRMFRECSRMDPTHLPTKVAMAEVARKLGKVDVAQQCLDEVFAVDPNCYPAISAQSILHYDLGHLSQAAEWNKRAMESDPNDLHLMLNQCLINMTYGRWPEWWGVYEYTLSYGKHNGRMKHLNRSESWQGDVKDGKTLLVVSDQGAGDAIQFGRFLGQAKELGKFEKLIYLVQPDVKQIAAALPGVDEAVGFGEREKIGRDEFTSLLGVMRALRVSPRTCARDFLIKPDPELVEIWRVRLDQVCASGKLRVALCWGGDPAHGNDQCRSIALAKFLPLTQVDGVQLLSFQVSKPAEQLNVLLNMEPPIDIPEMGSMFRDYSDTAAALANVDLLISVDTSILHLAGSMGVRAFGLIPNPPEWRWGLDGVDTRWYQSVELFRQTDPKVWEPVIAAVVARVSEMAEKAARSHALVEGA